MKDVWTGSLDKAFRKTEGKHPTQKPEYLLEKIVLASTEEGQVILDPFLRFWNYWSRGSTIWTKFYRDRYKRRILGDIKKRRLEKVANDK